MRLTLAVHIMAGTLGLLAGYVALFATKGATLHRRSGMLFICAMIIMCIGGLTIAVVRGVAPEINVPAALLTSYLIVTSFTTVRDVGALSSRGAAFGFMLVALGVGLTMVSFALQAFANGGTRNGMPAFPFIMFATFGLLGVAGDLHVIRFGARRGPARLARHLWRMSMALFIAALSFSFQFVRILRERGIPLPPATIAVPMLVVLVAMFYWLWRVRRKRSMRNLVLAADAA